MRFCLLCLRPLPRRRWWQLFTPAPLCPARDAAACRSAERNLRPPTDEAAASEALATGPRDFEAFKADPRRPRRLGRAPR